MGPRARGEEGDPTAQRTPPLAAKGSLGLLLPSAVREPRTACLGRTDPFVLQRKPVCQLPTMCPAWRTREKADHARPEGCSVSAGQRAEKTGLRARTRVTALQPDTTPGQARQHRLSPRPGGVEQTPHAPGGRLRDGEGRGRNASNATRVPMTSPASGLAKGPGPQPARCRHLGHMSESPGPPPSLAPCSALRGDWSWQLDLHSSQGRADRALPGVVAHPPHPPPHHTGAA